MVRSAKSTAGKRGSSSVAAGTAAWGLDRGALTGLPASPTARRAKGTTCERAGEGREVRLGKSTVALCAALTASEVGATDHHVENRRQLLNRDCV